MNKTPDIRTSQSGIGLVELLIALVLALVLTMGIIEVFLGSKQAYRTQDALSRVQENGRFAMEELSRNVRMSGFQGCGKMDRVTPNVVANGLPSGDFWSMNAVRGYAYNGSNFTPAFVGTAPSPIANTDVISVLRVMDCGTYLRLPMTGEGAAVELPAGNVCNLAQGDPVVITDCSSTDLFRISSPVPPSGDISLAHAQGVADYQNTRGRLSKPYANDARVFRLVQLDYYVRQNNFGEPALFRQVNGGVDEELVEGVEDFQVLFGEDTGTDFFVDEYRDATAVTDWSRVSSIRPVLSLRSKDANITLDNEPLRQDMTSTIGIRNRLP